MKKVVSPSAGSTYVSVMPVDQGGLGSTDAATAVGILGGIRTSTINQPNGILGLDVNALVDMTYIPNDVVNTISVTGLAEVTFSKAATYTITNYDAFTNYELAASLGTVSRVKDVITYTTPPSPGNAGFSVNGKVVPVVVTNYTPNKPTVAPATAGNASVCYGRLSSSPYAVNGGSAAHLSSDWQIATDVNFTNIVTQTSNNTSSKTYWTSGNLAFSTSYFARVRYRDIDNAISNWSTPVAFSTVAVYLPTTEVAKISPTIDVNQGYFCSAIEMSRDGTRAAVIASSVGDALVSAGAVYIFFLNNGVWTQEAKLITSDRIAYDEGKIVSINATGDRIVFGAYRADHSTFTDPGAVYIFTRTGTTWAQEAKLIASDKAASAQFGWSVTINDDGTRIAVGSPAINNFGAVYVFLRTGTTWAQEAKLVATDKLSGDNFGRTVAINADASRIVIGVIYVDTSPNSNNGAAYIFLRTGTAWAQETKLIPSVKTDNGYFGKSVAIAGDASRVFVGAGGVDGFTNPTDSVFIFLRTGTTWAQEARVFPSDPVTNATFPVSIDVDTAGSRMVMGLGSADNTDALGSGTIYVFLRTGTTWTQQGRVTSSDKAANDRFGIAVTMNGAGTRIMAGSMYIKVNGVNGNGAAYVFE